MSSKKRIAVALERLADAQAAQARVTDRMMVFWDEIAPLMLIAARRDLARTEKRTEKRTDKPEDEKPDESEDE